jgi:uncharacterized protein YcbX/ferredoxin-NADP reductase
VDQASAQLDSIHIYPLKSAGGIAVGSARLEAKGLAGDRGMMVIDAEGAALTARTAPGLLTISVQLDRNEVVLMAPDRVPLVIFLPSLLPMVGQASVWGDVVATLDGGDAAAAWLTALLQRPCRLALERADTEREAGLPQGGPVSFADTAPLLLVNAASLAAVNAQLETPVDMARFRANLVVSGVPAFDEDSWGIIRIGEVEFTVAAPCDRCVMITLDPESGASDPQREPLSLLVRHRRGADGKVYFGQFLVPRSTGRMFAGAPIEVLSRKAPPELSGPPLLAPTASLPPARTAATGRRSELLLTCVGRVAESADITSFRFEADRPIDYLPGQYLAILPEIDGKPVRRNYTISSSPSRPAHVSISVKRVEGGLVSNHLHDNLRVGDRLRAVGPGGKFHLGIVEKARPILMISAGSGITPMVSMLRYIADHNLDRDVRLHHSGRDEADLPFLRELELLQSQMVGTLAVSWNVTRPKAGAGRLGNVHAGRLDAAMLAAVSPDLAERTVLCCGPDGFRTLVRDLHATWPGPVNGAYAEESFGGERVAASQLPPIGRYDVAFFHSGGTATGEGARTLLDLARDRGIELVSDCEAGICGTCRCRIRSGEWQLADNCADPSRSALSDAEKQDGFVLACSSNPVGNVVVEL